MNRITLAASMLFVVLGFSQAGATGVVNTEAGTFRCQGSVVRFDGQGVPFSEAPDGKIKPCDPVIPIEDTI